MMATRAMFYPEMPLREARDVLLTLVEEGHKCPTCAQLAKVYRRKINSTMARTLITMHLHGAADRFVHTASLPGDTHEASQLSWWGLIEDERARRPDGGRTGYWKLTPLGVRFARGLATVPKYARIYDGKPLGQDGEQVTIQDCLGRRFSYVELMAGV